MSNWDKNLWQALILVENLMCQSCLFMLHHFAAKCLGSLHSKKRENEQVTAKKAVFEGLH